MQLPELVAGIPQDRQRFTTIRLGLIVSQESELDLHS